MKLNNSKFISYGKQSINENDIKSVIEVLKSDFITQGPLIPKFEKKVSQFCKSNYAVAFNSATSALHIACMSLGVGKNDLVWTSPNSFVASANCALYCGAKIDFVDIDKKTWCLSPFNLEKKLKYHKNMKLQMPKVVIPVHLGGLSCEMKKIKELSIQYGFKIIEDASHAIGGHYQQKKIGSCLFSDITIFSFHPVKIITTVEGGMALTNNHNVYEKLSRLRSHGIEKDITKLEKKDVGPWYYEQIDLGYNYRITDFQSALGMSQLKRIKRFIKKRNEIAQIYERELAGLDISFQEISNENISSRHLFIIKVSKSIHKQLFNYLRENKIGVNLHYIPIHLHPFYRNLGFKEGDFPMAENHALQAISLPIYPDLDKEDLMFVINKIKGFMNDTKII